MLVKRLFRICTLPTLVALLSVSGCNRDSATQPAVFPTDPAVFIDQFGSGVTFEAFGGSKLDALSVDESSPAHSGTASLKVIVPDSGDVSGSYAGGAFTTTIGRDLTSFDALTFWARADKNVTLNVVGIGNDNTDTSHFVAETQNLPLTTSWTKFTIPIPLASKLTAEDGLFYFAEGPENGVGCLLWFDDIQFEALGTITSPSADLGNPTLSLDAGQTDTLGSISVTFNVAGIPQTVTAMPGYFTFTSSNSGVVSVGDYGAITALVQGSSNLTAKLGSVNVAGSITVNVNAPNAVPTVAAPMPTVPAADVIALYSDAYTDVSVTTWSADWDYADVSDETVASDNVKKYTNLDYAGIEFDNPTIDASSMTRFHIDIWTPNATAEPAQFSIKLVDYGANGVYGGGDDKEQELSFSAGTAPALATGQWISIDLPLVAFSGLTTRAHLSQLILSGEQLPTVYVDNIYFYDAGEATAPEITAPTPTEDPADVVSLYSAIYTNTTVDTWLAVGVSSATLADYTLGSDTMKQYTNFNRAGINFLANPIDATTLTHFHMDVWTPDPTGAPATLVVKLVDLGEDGIQGGVGDVAGQIALDYTTMRSGLWVSVDIPLSSLTGLTTKQHLGQLVLSSTALNTIFVDNVYFYDSGQPTAPTSPAPTPTLPAGDVISLYSGVYTDVPVDTWSAQWDSADVAPYVIGTDSTKLYTNLLFAGIEFATPTIDASAMNYFHMDVWTPDPTDAPAVFKIKLVDWGADGAWQGGDDVEYEVTLDATTMNTGEWVSIDLPLTDFIDLTTRAHLAQMIISGDPNTVYVDNVYFHK